jgi:hypothetical protein
MRPIVSQPFKFGKILQIVVDVLQLPIANLAFLDSLQQNINRVLEQFLDESTKLGVRSSASTDV